jgi:hypothetical protein
VSRLVDIPATSPVPQRLRLREGDVVRLGASGVGRSAGSAVEVLGPLLTAASTPDGEIVTAAGTPAAVVVIAREPGAATLEVARAATAPGGPFLTGAPTRLEVVVEPATVT